MSYLGLQISLNSTGIINEPLKESKHNINITQYTIAVNFLFGIFQKLLGICEVGFAGGSLLALLRDYVSPSIRQIHEPAKILYHNQGFIQSPNRHISPVEWLISQISGIQEPFGVFL